MHIENSISQKVLHSWVELNKSWKGRHTKVNIKEIRTWTPNDFQFLREWKGPGGLSIKSS